MAHADTATRVEVGAVIANTYEIKRLLGRGGMGTVWEADHARLPGKRVAIKVLHPEVARDADSLARFRREAEIASRIGHPNIVDVHDFNELDDGTPYLILEYLEGCDLEERLRHGAMPLDATIALTRQVGSALRAAHREGVIHRDLKPQNVFLSRTTDADGNETERAKVLDFGISKIRGSQTVQTQDSAILGTPQYMAPEQATGAHRSVDARTDVFALGAMVYEMLAGRPAFVGQTIPEVVFKVVYEDPTPLDQVARVPANVARAVHVALSKKQEERWGSVEQFIEALSGTGLSVSGAAAPAPVAVDQALASTIASGAHTPVPGLGSDIGTANTIDSGRLSQDAVGIAHSQTQLADSAQLAPQMPAPPATPEPRRGGRGAKVAMLLAMLLLAAGGAVAAVLMSQENSGEVAGGETPIDAAAIADDVAAGGDAAPEIAVAETVDAAPRSRPAPPPVAVDAAPRAPAIDASRPAVVDDGVRRHGDDPPPDKTTEPKTPNQLREAEAMIGSNPREAIRLVRKAQRDGARGEASYAVLAMAHCKLLDLAPVKAALSRVRSKRLRRKVLRRCKQLGMDLE